MLIANAGVLGGLVLEYFQGASLAIIVGCGAFLFLFVNAIFLVRARRVKAPQ